MKKTVTSIVILAFTGMSTQGQVISHNALNLLNIFNKINPANSGVSASLSPGSFRNQLSSDRDVNSILFKPCKELTSDWDPNNNSWYYSDSVRRTYNSLGDITKKLWYLGFSTNPDKTIYVYNGNGKITSDTSMAWGGSSYVNNGLNTYVYDINSNKTQEISYNWSGSAWTGANKNDFTYDVNNNQTQHLAQSWNGNAWVDMQRENYTWSGGLLIGGLFQSWDGNAWIDVFKIDYTNLSGQTNEMTGSFWTGTSWQNYFKYINMVWYQWSGFFSESPKLSGYIEQVPIGSLWKDTMKYNWTYDIFGNQTDYLKQAKPSSVYITAGGFKNLYQYNGNNSITEDIQQNWSEVTQLYENYKKKEYSDFYEYTVVSCVPDQPGVISGNTTVNPGASETYSVTPVSGATSYNWTLPVGWSGSSVSNSITVVIGTAGGLVTVSAVNNCGTSAPAALTVTQANSGTSNCSPALFKDLRPGFYDSYPENFRELNGFLYFFNYDGLWKTNGTVAGTIRIDSLRIPTELEVLNNNLIFPAPSSYPAWQLWKSDGTGSSLIMDFSDGSIANLTSANGFMFFTVEVNYVSKLWRTDGTAAGTILVKDIDPSNNINYCPTGFFEFNNNVYFRAGNDVNGNELWKSNGTEPGTTMVKDIQPGAGSGHNTPVYAILNNELYFYANDPLQYGLWKTDGSDAGTTFIKECIWISEISTINNVLYFSAYDIGANTGNTLYGEELWKSDGTPVGTYMVKDINTGISGSKQNNYQFKVINSIIVFSAKDGINGLQLWKTNGTESGTVLLKNINQIGLSSSKVFNGFLYFSANDGTTGGELWKTDGTETGTALVADLYPGADGSSPFDFTIFNGNLFFRAESASAGVELWTCGATSSSVSDVESENIISIYPNPSNDLITVENKNGKLNPPYFIFNTLGQQLFTGKLTGEITKIDINFLSSGIYLLQVGVSGKQMIKLIKK